MACGKRNPLVRAKLGYSLTLAYARRQHVYHRTSLIGPRLPRTPSRSAARHDTWFALSSWLALPCGAVLVLAILTAPNFSPSDNGPARTCRHRGSPSSTIHGRTFLPTGPHFTICKNASSLAAAQPVSLFSRRWEPQHAEQRVRPSSGD